jgi:hypothetical protein
LNKVLKIIQIHEHCIDLLLLVGFLHVTIRSNVEADEKQHTAHSQPSVLLCYYAAAMHHIDDETGIETLKLEETKHTKKNHASYDRLAR